MSLYVSDVALRWLRRGAAWLTPILFGLFVPTCMQLEHDDADLATARGRRDDAAERVAVSGNRLDRAVWSVLRPAYGSPDDHYGPGDGDGEAIDTPREAAAALWEDFNARSEKPLARLVATGGRDHDTFLREIAALDEETRVMTALQRGEGGIREAAGDLDAAQRELVLRESEVERLADRVDRGNWWMFLLTIPTILLPYVWGAARVVELERKGVDSGKTPRR